jgi:hypothetical protein
MHAHKRKAALSPTRQQRLSPSAERFINPTNHRIVQDMDDAQPRTPSWFGLERVMRALQRPPKYKFKETTSKASRLYNAADFEDSRAQAMPSSGFTDLADFSLREDLKHAAPEAEQIDPTRDLFSRLLAANPASGSPRFELVEVPVEDVSQAPLPLSGHSFKQGISAEPATTGLNGLMDCWFFRFVPCL